VLAPLRFSLSEDQPNGRFSPREDQSNTLSGMPRSCCGRSAAIKLMPDMRLSTAARARLPISAKRDYVRYLLSSSYPDSRRKAHAIYFAVRPDRSIINPRAVRILLLPSSGRRRVLFHVSLLFPALVRWFTQRAARQHSNKTTSPHYLILPSCERTIAASHDTRLRPQVL
jgi:hypothetical protein